MKKLLVLICCLAVPVLMPHDLFAQFSLAHLQTEYSETPLGIDVAEPRFSWQMQAPAGVRGAAQQAYRIVVRDGEQNIVWDTGQVDREVSVHIVYGGEALQPTTRYEWEVTVWDQGGETATAASWFETGLLNPDPNLSGWDGATWIGGGDDDLVFYPHYLSVFKLRYTLQLGSGSTRARFVYGANDRRLMDAALNIYRLANAKDASYIALEIDIAPLDEGGDAQLNIYRVGYHPNDAADTPLASFDIPQALINDANQYAPHTVYLESEFGQINIFINGQADENKVTIVENPNPNPFGTPRFNLNPVGSGGDFISFPMVADFGFAVDAGQRASFSDVEVQNYRYPSNALFHEDLGAGYDGAFADAAQRNAGLSIADGAFVLDGGGEGTQVIADASRNAVPMLRTTFTTAEKQVAQARLYATARGIYELYLNGERVGDRYFTPGLTQYNRIHHYQTYDVTDLVDQGGANALGAWLGEGWWSGNITYTGANWNFFGDRQALLAKLVITYEDGTSDVVVTTPDTWSYFGDGPIRYGSFFQGEVYDATREATIDGWNTAAYDDAAWKAAVTVPLEGTAYIGPETTFQGDTDTFSYDRLELVGQVGENPGVAVTRTAQRMDEVRPGVFVYDMGQNMVGFPRITLPDGPAGEEITLRFAEVRYPNLEAHQGNIGMVMLENIRGALAHDVYVRKGGEEVIQPRFTFHGYRYIEITGLDAPLPLEAVEGVVISSVETLASHLETSNDLVNKLWENITWSLRGNFLSIPTDTPARNERMGWSGDIMVFARAATYLADVEPFMRRHLRAMRDLQRGDGRFPDVAPVGGGFGGTLWGNAGMVVPWETYRQYGDVRLLEEHYDAMKRYVAFLASSIDSQTGVVTDGPLGDWLSPENSRNDNALLWSAYYVYDLEILARTAELLGHAEDAAIYWAQHAERKAHFNATFIDPETHQTIHSGYNPPFRFGGGGDADAGTLVDTQASYAVPLALGVISDENAPHAAANLASAVRRGNVDDSGVPRPGFSLMTGFIGTASLNPALSAFGYDDMAYRMLQQTTYPSWLYPVVNGATTIWERLNSYTLDDGFGGNNSMNSFNHYAFGAVGAWLYNHTLGIQRDPQVPAFKRFILQPTPDPNGIMKWGDGYYDSPYGRIESAWRVEDGTLTYRATVPPNTTAMLYFPASSADVVQEGDGTASQAAGVRYVEASDGKVVYELASGTYTFTAPWSGLY